MSGTDEANETPDTPQKPDMPDTADTTESRAGTILGWFFGASTGLVVDWTLATVWGERYPAGYSTFILLTLCAFLGMGLADRLGTKAPRVLGPLAGVMVSLCFVLFAFGALSR